MYGIAALCRRQKSGAETRKPCFYKRWGFLASVLILALVSAGCGSSGGGSSSSSPTLLNPIRVNGGLGVATGEGIADVSRALPSVDDAGTVVQSSNVDDSGMTTDTVGAFDISLDSSGQLEGSVTLGPEDSGTTLTVENDLFAHGSVEEDQAIRHVDLRDEDIPNAAGDGTDTILMRVYSSVTADADADTDYFAAGVWVRTPTDTESVTDEDSIEVGAFAAGTRLFDAANIQTLTGTAEYEGYANGLYTHLDAESTREVGFFDATVELTADFGDTSQLGTISGELSNFRDEDGEELEGFDGDFALGSAAITNLNDGGFFQGTIQRDAGNFNGNWGGAFHGIREDGNPAAIHGTFGIRGAPEVGASRAVGVFAAPQTSP